MATYRDFAEAMRSLSFKDVASRSAGVVCLVGPSEYLLLKARRALIERWEADAAGAAQQHDAERIDGPAFAQIVSQRSLFEPMLLHVIQGAGKRPDFVKMMATITAPSALRNWLAFVHEGPDLPEKLAIELGRFRPFTVPCFAPVMAEVPAFAKALARKFGAQLADDGAAFLVECVGNDLFKLENEIQKLALIFAGAAVPISARDIAPHCGLLREDVVFKLEDHLMAGRFAESQWFVGDLLRRGESPGAILGFIAHHCRKALGVKSLLAQGSNPRTVASTLRLPLGAVSNYTGYVNRTQVPERLVRGLRACQVADIGLKTSRADSDLLIAAVLQAFDSGG